MPYTIENLLLGENPKKQYRIQKSFHPTKHLCAKFQLYIIITTFPTSACRISPLLARLPTNLQDNQKRGNHSANIQFQLSSTYIYVFWIVHVSVSFSTTFIHTLSYSFIFCLWAVLLDFCLHKRSTRTSLAKSVLKESLMVFSIFFRENGCMPMSLMCIDVFSPCSVHKSFLVLSGLLYC